MTKIEWLFKKLKEVENKLQKDSLFRETHQDVLYTDKKYFELLDEQRIISSIIDDLKELDDIKHKRDLEMLELLKKHLYLVITNHNCGDFGEIIVINNWSMSKEDITKIKEWLEK